MSEEAKWYVVHTYSGYENKVAQTILKVVENRKLQGLITEVIVPTETAMEQTESGKIHEVEHKVFPGYVLVKMILTDDSWYVVRNTRGVTGFVGPGSKPVPLTEKEVEQLGVERGRTVEVNFAVGDSVKISGGPMEGFMGTVQGINTDDLTVDVQVSMSGRETLATLEITQVVKSDF
ncbi:MAG: transcription termination/antitermination protein NusG [Oscillospiraceae bacterium]|nr:transcription termination/antitermination protein NusG [Oscillospiraceae bacterium]